MDSFIDKKSQSGLGGWSTRCWRLRNCELVQYKRGIDAFEDASDSAIKKRYNIYEIRSVSIGAKTPYVLKVEYDTKYGDEPITVLLKFDNTSKKKYVDHLAFTAWFRVLCATSKLPFNAECNERPIPSPIAFALYYCLQKLYLQRDIFSTGNIFSKKLTHTPKNRALMEKLYYALLVNHRKKYLDMKDSLDDDIHVLCATLTYALQNMPTSLFCDSLCEPLTNFVMDVLEQAESRAYDEDRNYVSKLKATMDVETEDIDVLVLNRKEYINQIGKFFFLKYSKNKKSYKEQNGFSLFNRYGFIVILFLLLGRIVEKYSAIRMSAAKLAHALAIPLQSKRYLFRCRTELLKMKEKLGSNSKKKLENYTNPKQDVEYEQRFQRMIKILIFFAKDLFPGLDKVTWKVTSLVHCQGQEKIMVKNYNDTFSAQTMNEYYIAPILSKNKKHGDFNGHYFDGDVALKKPLSVDSELQEGDRNARPGSRRSGADALTIPGLGGQPQNQTNNDEMEKFILQVNGEPLGVGGRQRAGFSNVSGGSHEDAESNKDNTRTRAGFSNASYGSQRRASYHEQPAYHSDIGISELEDAGASDVDRAKATSNASSNVQPTMQKPPYVVDDDGPPLQPGVPGKNGGGGNDVGISNIEPVYANDSDEDEEEEEKYPDLEDQDNMRRKSPQKQNLAIDRADLDGSSTEYDADVGTDVDQEVTPPRKVSNEKRSNVPIAPYITPETDEQKTEANVDAHLAVMKDAADNAPSDIDNILGSEDEQTPKPADSTPLQTLPVIADAIIDKEDSGYLEDDEKRELLQDSKDTKDGTAAGPKRDYDANGVEYDYNLQMEQRFDAEINGGNNNAGGDGGGGGGASGGGFFAELCSCSPFKKWFGGSDQKQQQSRNTQPQPQAHGQADQFQYQYDESYYDAGYQQQTAFEYGNGTYQQQQQPWDTYASNQYPHEEDRRTPKYNEYSV